MQKIKLSQQRILLFSSLLVMLNVSCQEKERTTASTLDTFGLTNLDILNMPARSLSLEIDEGVYSYLNIPAQLVYRDTATQQFTFTGLSFTSKPLY